MHLCTKKKIIGNVCPIYKKGSKKERKKAYASKALQRLLNKMLEVFVIPELLIDQTGFGRGERNKRPYFKYDMDDRNNEKTARDILTTKMR